ncbi:unnamed protein product [Caenorhabditis nigoni]
MSSGRVKREEPEFDEPSNMERVARNNKRHQAARDQPQESGDGTHLSRKKIKLEKPESDEPIDLNPKPVVRTITPNEDSTNSSQESSKENTEDNMVPERESSKKVVCKTCDKSINGNRLTDRKRHALSHLKLKTWECTICHNSFSRSENGPRHFKTCHPDVSYVRFVRTTTKEGEEQLRQMNEKCFPNF